MFAYDDRPPPFGVDGYDAKTEFNCVQPRSRAARRAVADKESLEKDRLKNRFGGRLSKDTRTQDFTDMHHTHTAAPVGAAGYMPNSNRFICGGFDIAEEEKLQRTGAVERRFQTLEHRRDVNADREEIRWEKIDTKAVADKEKWDRYRDHGGKARRNKKSVPFDLVSLSYEKTGDGDRLRANDNVVRYRAAQRAENLQGRSNSAGFNPVTGADNKKLQMPDKPAILRANEKQQRIDTMAYTSQ